ncbi:nitroreductase family deazaflavin-dependent oxidoreductase [Xylanimonas sp. McL0601]|uniref:nitroreductase family deazaflavin-dependent oxidoreductase n=1 Tax=Xylanimonas sp. McL0601 TaxID=3414739 RepID=UPI003CEC64D3
MTSDGVGRVKATWLRIIKHSLNHLTLRAARSGRGPFTLVRHLGRTSGRTYETPLVLARTPNGFVTELTYGTQVQWFRNVVAAGGCTVVRGAQSWQVGAPQVLDVAAGLAAFPPSRRVVLRLLRRREFRLLPFVRPPAL